MPSVRLLKKFDLPQFIGLVEAIKTGNLKLFNDSLSENYQFFAQTGIYLTLERTKSLVFRTLLKKM